MSESNESSYYEIALTNRQVLVSFVVLLCCVLAAFVSGVWVGRKGSEPLLEDGQQLAAAETAAGDLEQLEEFKFFSDQEKNDGAVASPQAGTNPAEDPAATPPPPATPPSPRATPPPSGAASAPTPRATPPPPRADPAPPPEPASPPAAARPQEGFFVQVLSTRDEDKAERILNQLRQSSYPAFLSPVQTGNQVSYRVRIGPYPDRPPAEKAAAAVNRKYKLDTWIAPVGN